MKSLIILQVKYWAQCNAIRLVFCKGPLLAGFISSHKPSNLNIGSRVKLTIREANFLEGLPCALLNVKFWLITA